MNLDEEIASLIGKVSDEYADAFYKMLDVWQKYMLFTWRWWLDLALAIIPWVIWLKVREKASTHRLLYAGFVVMMLTSFLDMLGMSLGIWSYNSRLVPLVPGYLPWDFTLMPVTAMLFYQFKPRINPWIKAAVYSGIGSFVVQPLFDLIESYEPESWAHWYSFPIILVIYMIGYYFFSRKRFEPIVK
jgi:hypothetical protein